MATERIAAQPDTVDLGEIVFADGKAGIGSYSAEEIVFRSV